MSRHTVEQHEPLKPGVEHGSPADAHEPRSAHAFVVESQRPLQHCPSVAQGSPPPRQPVLTAHTQPEAPPVQALPAVSAQLPEQQSGPVVHAAPTSAHTGGGGAHVPLASQKSVQQSSLIVQGLPWGMQPTGTQIPSQLPEQHSLAVEQSQPFGAHAPPMQGPASAPGASSPIPPVSDPGASMPVASIALPSGGAEVPAQSQPTASETRTRARPRGRRDGMGPILPRVPARVPLLSTGGVSFPSGTEGSDGGPSRDTGRSQAPAHPPGCGAPRGGVS